MPLRESIYGKRAGVPKPLHSSVLSSWHANIFIMIEGPPEARKDAAFRCTGAEREGSIRAMHGAMRGERPPSCFDLT